MPLYNVKAPALPTAPADYDQRQFDQFAYVLRLYFNQLDAYNAAASTPQHGDTANRPTQNLQIGQFYFDTDLGTTGKPIWYDGSDWVDATGTVV